MQLPTRWKTYVAAALAGLCAFNHVCQIVPHDVCEGLLAAAAAMGLIGISHDVPKAVNGSGLCPNCRQAHSDHG